MANWQRQASRLLYKLDVAPNAGTDTWGTTSAANPEVGSVVVPGGAMGANGILRIDTYCHNPGGTATTCTLTGLFAGSLNWLSIGQGTNDTMLYRALIINQQSESVQICNAAGDPGGGGWGTAGNPPGEGTIDTTQDQTLTWNLDSDGANPCLIEMVTVEVIR